MVRGLDRFRAHFQGYEESYILIGGAACYLSMESVGEEFRVTKDLDIVLCAEALNVSFVNAFWEFVRAGGYKNKQKSTGKKLFYRFNDPEDKSFPAMLELFSRIPDALSFEGEGYLTPIPMGEEASSLSAILLNNEYYQFIQSGKRKLDGLSVLQAEYLIPLKARAWLDLTERHQQGADVDKQAIRKHKNDVLRLFRIIAPDSRVDIPEPVQVDLNRFFDAVSTEPVDLKPFGYRNSRFDAVLAGLKGFYGIND